MSEEPALAYRSALGDASGQGVMLTAMSEGHVVLLLTRTGAHAPEVPGLLSGGPGQWFLVGDDPLGADDLAALAALPEVAICDQSHGRVRIEVSGASASAMLAKGTAVDLDALPVGGSATTMIGTIGVHLTRTADMRFQLMVLRSFAAALWHDLEAMAAE